MKDYLSEFQTALDGLKIELRSSSVEQSQSEKREWRKVPSSTFYYPSNLRVDPERAQGNL